MKFNLVQSKIAGIPYIEPQRAAVLYNFILDNQLKNCLELGFAYGVSSCYIAAALDEMGEGHLTAVDLKPAIEWQKPSIEELLAKTGLQRWVTIVRERTTYNWFLMKMIEQQTSGDKCEPIYDFCFIDGPKNWTIDSSAFFSVDKLLQVGGWILFDDYGWIYGDREKMYGINLDDMGEEERNIPHIKQIFHLLVKQNPNYADFIIEDETWAWAHKVKHNSTTPNLVDIIKAKITSTINSKY